MAGAQEQWSAGETLAPLDSANTVDPDAKNRAAAANVDNASYIGYAAALAAYEARSDIEPLADRRARDIGDAFADTNFVRSSVDDVHASTVFNNDGTVDHDSNPATGGGV